MANKRIYTVDIASTLYPETNRHGWWGFVHRINKNGDTTSKHYDNIRLSNIRRMRALQDALVSKRLYEESAESEVQ